MANTETFYLNGSTRAQMAALVRCQRLIGWLARSRQDGAQELANILAHPGWRRSGACPMHQAELQVEVIESVDFVFGRGIPLIAVSWFPRECAMPLGYLSGFNVDRFMATRRRAVQRMFPDAAAFAVADVSLRVSTGGRAVWIPELRLLMEIENSKALPDLFRHHCGSDWTAVRPVRTVTITESNRSAQLSGATAPMPRLHTHVIDPAGGVSTKVRSLVGEAAVEAALFCHRFPLRSRLILRRLRRLGGRSGFGLTRLN